MSRCPITYQPCQEKYSKSGLAKLSPRLSDLADLPFTAQEQRREAASRSGKMSIQGVQPKLSARLSLKNQELEIVHCHGTFIIKPQSDIFKELPENEDLTMKMAKSFGIEVPLTGLVYSVDRSLSYFIKRFDRYKKNQKYHVEDFAQLTSNTRETKYNWSMEKLTPIFDRYCTFPLLEKKKLFRRILFCFITGNEDMHLKNFSLITRKNMVQLSPAYDLLNSTISIDKSVEELALPIAGEKRKIKKEHLIDYYGRDILTLTAKTISSEMHNLVKKKKKLENLIGISFLSIAMKEKYLMLISERYKRLTE